MIKLGNIDLNYLLTQVNIGNDYTKLRSAIDPNGVREVSGSNNNLVGGFTLQPDGTFAWTGGNVHPDWGQADTDFLRLFTTDHPTDGTSFGVTYGTVKLKPLPDAAGNPFQNPAWTPTFDANGLAIADGSGNTWMNSAWTPTFDANEMGNMTTPAPGESPRTISQLITSSDVDPASPTYNPAAAAAMNALGGQAVDVSNSVVGVSQTAEIPNPGILGGVPYNEFFVAFGQFFDHGLDFISKNGGYVLIPLSPSDPLYDGTATGSMANMMMLSRASLANPADDFVLDNMGNAVLKPGVTPQFNNNTGLLIDQSQTYGSHESVNVLLRQYDANGVKTGFLVTSAEDMTPPGAGATQAEIDAYNKASHDLGTWADVKVNAMRIGIELIDTDVLDAPMIKADAVGSMQFTPQQSFMFRSDQSIADINAAMNTANGTTGVDYYTNGLDANDPFVRDANGNVLKSNQPILIDINPAADPSHPGYDANFLAQHYISGDGRVNENVGLTMVHHVFHEEHNIQAHNLMAAAIEDALRNNDLTALNGTGIAGNAHENGWLAQDVTMAQFIAATGLDPATATSAQIDAFVADSAAMDAAIAAMNWDGEFVYQAARIITESEYNHVAIDQFVGTLYPLLPEFVSYSTDINLSVSLEFSQAVYRLGHSMLMENLKVGVADSGGNMPGDPGYVAENFTDVGLFNGFLNPGLYATHGPAAIAAGLLNEQGNEVDEFVTAALQQSLVGVPLDLAALNIARGRDVGLPTLNELRKQVFDGLTQNTSNNSNASGIAPYSSWEDFGGHLRTPESLVNFIAAYGRENTVFHLQDMRAYYEQGLDANGVDPSVSGNAAVSLQDLRANAQHILDLAAMDPNDPANAAIASDITAAQLFMRGNGQPVYDPTNPNAVNGWVFSGGAGDQGFWDIDLWIGGLAEQPLFDGPLGTTFSFVMLDFAQRMQDGDRFYYLYRMPMGHHLGDQIIGEQFADLVQRTTGLEHTGDAFGYQSGYFYLDGANHEDLRDGDSTDGDPTTDPNGLNDYFNAIYETLPDSVKNFVVANKSFEIDSLATPDHTTAGFGSWVAGAPIGWDLRAASNGNIVAGGGGVVDPTAVAIPAAGHNGSQVAYLGKGRALTQDIGNALVAGSTYTVAANIGNRANTTNDFQVQFRLVDNATGNVIDQSAIFTDADVPNGQWANLQWTSGAIDSTYDGSNFRIEIVNLSAAGPGSNELVLIDDVSLVETTPGGSANDGHIVVAGFEGNDYIIAGLGDDYVYGDAGDDVIEGAQGNDHLYGGDGNDWITDYENDDFIHGGAGDDYISAGPGVLDTVHGGDGNDEVHGGDGIDEVFGDDGDDRIYGEGDTDLLMGGQGNDYIDGGDSVDEAFGGDGNDWLRGGVGDDNLNGGAGNDLMEGGMGPVANDGDRMNGDWIGINQVGANETDGGVGQPGDMDIVSYEEAGYGVTGSLQNSNANGTASNMLDTYALDEGLVGSGYADVLEGADANTITGNGPKNQLIGGGDNDRLTGLGDNDWLFGGAAVVRNNLWVDLAATLALQQDGTLSSTYDAITNPTGYEVITDWEGTGETRVLFHNADGTTELGHILGDNFQAAGADGNADVAVYRGNLSDFNITADNATGVVTVQDMRTLAAAGVNHDGTDKLLGIERLEFNGVTNDLVVGTPGNDAGLANRLEGDRGNAAGVNTDDIMFGLAGNDVMIGYGGNDLIAGGTGNDRIWAGGGNDTIVWNDGDGHDIVNGGPGGTDTFVINANGMGGTFQIYAVTNDATNGATRTTLEGMLAAAGSLIGGVFRPWTEIVVLKDGVLVAELGNIEELVVNAQPLAVPAGNNTGLPVAAPVSVIVSGDFGPTSLNTNTITINGADGDDMVDISGLQSDHRIVFDGGAGNDHVMGAIRPQDVVSNATYMDPGNGGGNAGNGGNGGGNGGTNGDTGGMGGDASAGSGDNGSSGSDEGDSDSSDAPESNHLNEAVTGTGEGDTLQTDDGRDVIFGLDGNDNIIGGEGADMLFGDGGNDRIFGEDGNDVIDAGAGNDMVFAGDGDDIILASVGDGDDTYWGDDPEGDEDGVDTLDMSAVSADVDANLGTGFMGRGGVYSEDTGHDTLWGIENIVTGSGDDTITAGSAVNIMDGGDGNDMFVFRSAEDADGDLIVNFQPGDKIDLSGIDAMHGGDGDQSFTLVSDGFTGAMGELMVSHEIREDGDYTVIEGQIGCGDAPDFKLSLKGYHDLTDSDFNL